MKSNRTMDMNVLALAPTKHQAIVRSAGQEGVVLYELLVERGMARSHVKMANHQHGIQHVPFWLPTEHKEGINEKDVLVVDGSESNFPRYYGPKAAPDFRFIELQGFEEVTAVSGLLFECWRLTTVDLTPLSNVTAIRAGFLELCSSLVTIDLTPLRNVTTMELAFLRFCTSLATVDLAPLSNVTEITGDFLFFCSSLTAVDLTPLSNLTVIRDGFLCGCSSLTTIDLAPLGKVTVIEGRFLCGCSSLTTIDLTPLSSVTVVEEGFLLDCLANVDVTPMIHISQDTWSTIRNSKKWD